MRTIGIDLKKQLMLLRGFFVLAIFTLVLLSGIMKVSLISFVLAAVAAAISIIVEPFSNMLKERDKKERRIKLLKKYISELNNFLSKNFSVKTKIQAEGLEFIDSELNKIDTYRTIIDQLNIEYNKDVVFVLALCHEIEKEPKESDKSLYRDRIDKVLDNFDTVNIDPKTKELLELYSKLKGVPLDNYRKMFFDFTRKYCRAQSFAFQMFNDLKQAKEFNRTLSFLIFKGKIPTKPLREKVEEKKNMLLKEKKASRGLIVLMNYYKDKPYINNALDSFPQIEMGRLKPLNFPEKTKYLHMRLLYPKSYYYSAREFLDKEIIGSIPEEEKGKGFIAVLPIETLDICSYPETQEEIYSEKMKDSFSAINYLRTGSDKGIYEILSEYIISEMGISGILSIIPFNVFVPDLPQEGKNFLIENYEYIKEPFGIESLFDWSEVDVERLSQRIISKDKSKILSEEKWKEVCEQIRNEASKCAESVVF